jgi:hypothetical protein
MAFYFLANCHWVFRWCGLVQFLPDDILGHYLTLGVVAKRDLHLHEVALFKRGPLGHCQLQPQLSASSRQSELVTGCGRYFFCIRFLRFVVFGYFMAQADHRVVDQNSYMYEKADL